MIRRKLLLTTLAVILTITGSALLANVAPTAEGRDALGTSQAVGVILEDAAGELALLEQGEVTTTARSCQICFGIKCQGHSSGYVCNPFQGCTCQFCGGQFNCFY